MLNSCEVLRTFITVLKECLHLLLFLTSTLQWKLVFVLFVHFLPFNLYFSKCFTLHNMEFYKIWHVDRENFSKLKYRFNWNIRKMVFDITLQTELNKKENKLYPLRKRDFYANFSGYWILFKNSFFYVICTLLSIFVSVLPLTGKFYARHDFTDSDFFDSDLENAILKHKNFTSRDKYSEPVTDNME